MSGYNELRDELNTKYNVTSGSNSAKSSSGGSYSSMRDELFRKYPERKQVEKSVEKDNTTSEEETAAAAEAAAEAAKAEQDAEKKREQNKQAAQTAYNKAVGRTPTLTQSQLDNAAVKNAEKNTNAATKAYDTYQKSEERKTNVDAATNEILKKVFGNLGNGNLDLSLQNAPQQMLDAETKEKELRAKKDYAEQQEQTAKDTKTLNTDMAELDSWSKEDKAGLEAYIREEDNLQNRQNWDILSNDTNPESTALIQKYGIEKVLEMAESYRRQQSNQLARQAQQDGADGANKGFLSSVGHNVGSVGANLMGAVSGPLGYVQELGQRTGRYSTLNPNNIGQLPSVYASGVRNQTAENIEKSDTLRRMGEAITGAAEYTQTGEVPAMKVHQPEKEGQSSTAGKVGATIYKAGMSAADTLARAGMGGGSKLVSLGLAAGNSFGNTVSQASRQGASGGQAMLLGAVNAGIEVATEYIPLDELLKTAKNSTAGVKEILTSVLKQAGIEATEEEISLIGTTLAEAAILREKSGYTRQIQEQVANGASYEQAKQEADRALMAEAGETAIVSAMSGGMSAAGAAIGGKATANTDTRTEKSEVSKLADQLLKGLTRKNSDTQTNQTDTADGNQQAQKSTTSEEAVQELNSAIAKSFAEQDAEQIMNQDPGRYSIREDMSEDERYDHLKDRSIHVITDDQSANYPEEMSSLAELKAKAKGKAEKIIRPLAKKLGILNRDMRTPEVEVEFQFSTGGLNESIHKQLRYGGDYSDFAKTIVNLDKVLENAVLVEKHGDKYAGTSRESKYLENVSVLFGAFRDGDSIIPVQMEIKKTSDSGSHLYMTVAMTKTEADVPGKTIDRSPSPSLISASEYNIADIFKKINPQDAHFLKYVPDNFLSDEQITAKQSALEEDAAKIQRYKETGSRSAPMVDTQEQSTEGGQETESGIPDGFEAMGAASAGFSGTAGYDALLYDGNIQRARKGDAREIEVPIEDADGRKVSEFVGNSMNSEVTPETFTDTIKKIVADGQASHDVLTNEEALQKAAEQIKEDGSIYESVQKLKAVAQSGKTSPEDVAKARLLYEHLTNQIDQQLKNEEEPDTLLQDMAKDTYISLAQLATNSGRSMQLFNLFRRMTPEYQAKVLESEVIREVEKLQKQGTVKKDYQVQVDTELLEEYREAAEAYRKAEGAKAKKEAEQKMQDIQNALYLAEAAKLPASFKAKWDAWRYMAMMGNVKTQVRNFLGNASFMPYVSVKNIVSTAMEKAFIRDKSKRTKAFVGLSESDRALRSWAKADAKSENVQNVLKGSAKLGDDMTKSDMADNMHIYNNKLGEKARNKVNDAVERGDMWFKNPYYADALAGFIKAKGYTAADIEAGRVSDDLLNEGRAYAIDEAMKATFNDQNVLSDFLAKEMRYKGDNPIGKAVNTMFEGILPFRRTPANIVVRFAEYSPVGLTRGAVNTIRHLAGGDVSAATAIDQLASGLTGTGMAALGYAMASGIFGFKLRGSNVDEEEEEQGHQKYALEFTWGGKDYSYTVDWAAPANLPLFLGANLYEKIHNSGGNSDMSAFTSFAYALGTMFEPLLQLSCLSSLNDLFETGKYSDGDAIYSVLTQAATSYLAQGIPSLIRQADQASHENKQQTFANSSDPLLRDAQRTAANVPFLGDALQVDSVDEWGNAVSRGGVGQRIFDAFANPGTLKQVDNSDLETEISRLGDAQEENVRPPEVAKTISYTDADGNKHTNDRLTGEQYTTLKTVQGRTAKSILDAMISGDDYKALTDEQKAEAFGYAYDYAREKARTEAIEGYEGLDAWMEGIEGREAQSIVEKVAAGSLDSAMTAMKNAWRNDYDTAAPVSELEEAYNSYQGLSEEAKKAALENTSSAVQKYIEARDAGTSTVDFNKVQMPALLMDDAIDDLKEAIKTGTDTAAAAQDLENTYQLYRGLTTAQTKTFRENISSATKAFLDAKVAGVKAETFANLYAEYTGIAGQDNKSEFEKAEDWAYVLQKSVEARKITQAQADTMEKSLGFWQIIPADADSYNKLVDNGISADKSKDLMYLLDGIVGTGKVSATTGKAAVRDIDKWECIADKADFLTEEEMDIAIKLYMTDYDPTATKPDRTELKYDYARQEMDISAQDYMDAYRAYSNNSKKEEQISAIMKQGFSWSMATTLYNLYKGRIDVEDWYNDQ